MPCIFCHAFQVKCSQIYFDTSFLCILTVGLSHRVDRKLYTLIGGQHAEKFENHCSKQWCLPFSACNPQRKSLHDFINQLQQYITKSKILSPTET